METVLVTYGKLNKTRGAPCAHGMTNSPEYKSWESMKTRCGNPNAKKYRIYGARGIKVCERWLRSFANFYTDMGPKPTPQHSIDRIDNDGNYEPGNCRWATKHEQGTNRRGNVMLTHEGQTLCVFDWARKIGLAPKTLHARLAAGWSPERALTTPLDTRFWYGRKNGRDPGT